MDAEKAVEAQKPRVKKMFSWSDDSPSIAGWVFDFLKSHEKINTRLTRTYVAVRINLRTMTFKKIIFFVSSSNSSIDLWTSKV